MCISVKTFERSCKVSHACFRLTKNHSIITITISKPSHFETFTHYTSYTKSLSQFGLFRTLYDLILIAIVVLFFGTEVILTRVLHTRRNLYFLSFTYQSIHQYLIETINLSLLEPHFIYRLR